MATYTKFESGIENIFAGVHDLMGTSGSGANALKAYLSNAAPSASGDSVKTDMAEIATGSGYAGAVALDNVGTRTAGTVTVTAKSFTVTASGGPVGPFQYVPIYDDTTAVLTNPLLAYYDYAAPLTLADGESFTVKFNGAAVGANGTLFTAA